MKHPSHSDFENDAGLNGHLLATCPTHSSFAVSDLKI